MSRGIALGLVALAVGCLDAPEEGRSHDDDLRRAPPPAAPAISARAPEAATVFVTDYLSSQSLAQADVCIVAIEGGSPSCARTDAAGVAAVKLPRTEAEITVTANGYLPFRLLTKSAVAFSFRPVMLSDSDVRANASRFGIDWHGETGLVVGRFWSFPGAVPPAAKERALVGTPMRGASFHLVSAGGAKLPAAYLASDGSLDKAAWGTSGMGIGLLAVPLGRYRVERTLPSGSTCRHLGGAAGEQATIRVAPNTVTAVFTECVVR